VPDLVVRFHEVHDLGPREGLRLGHTTVFADAALGQILPDHVDLCSLRQELREIVVGSGGMLDDRGADLSSIRSMTRPTPAAPVKRSFSPVRTRSTVPLTRRVAPRVMRTMKVTTALDVAPATRASVAYGRQPGVIAL
jgi:hypothetical protein